ncbi:MAG: peptidyl-prolyl cis-trans isomerase [Candidatus Marinimicrobia bacterium]|nr:peptidyl-prolyl cis-trans isomerase [Candidatus Neomarinimicrobiota bacterium]MCF7829124.1 peptidyl-prolyl cis-trans isomerase [Candidatus Neomarinimicrobiota bacterium]MCF7881477.1 peptidyl-prolyl cis-trans isomerase [Candidatus Neomarinimicrobiota bacterium]
MCKRGIVFLLAAALLWSCDQNEPSKNYLARVDDTYLTRDDLKFLSIIDPDGKIPEAQLQGFLNDWIDTEILAQQALKHDLDQDPYLKNRLESFKKKLLADTYIRYNIYTSLKVSEQEIREYYEEHKQVFMWEHDAAEVTHYFAANEDTARQVYNILSNGTAEEKTLLYQKNRPDTKVVTGGDMVQELQDAVFGTRASGVLRPVESDFGYHVLVVQQRFQAGTYQTLEQVRDEIRERLLVTEQKQHYYEVLDSLKGVIDFEINKQMYNNISGEPNQQVSK